MFYKQLIQRQRLSFSFDVFGRLATPYACAKLDNNIIMAAKSSSEPLPLEEGALYTVDERLNTFQVAHCSWPFDSGPCTPLKMAEAGFYFCGTDQAPDWVRCIVCHHDMEGWEATDVPR